MNIESTGGKLKTYNININIIGINKSNRIAKKEWLRAFFDCEAYVCRNHIKIQTVNKAGMLEVKSLLEEFDIPSRYYVYTPKNEKWKVNHMLFLVKEARKNYLDNIGFNHSIKQSKLKKSQNF